MFPGQGGQGGANRPPWQQGPGVSSGGRGNGPPPAKRSRIGPGPVITYYPPPPGYTGPARPSGPFQQPGWPQPQPPQQFASGQTPHPGYQNQAYGTSQPYQQPSYPGLYAAPQPPNPANNPFHQQMNYPAYHPQPPAQAQAGYNNMTQQWSGGAQQYPPNAQQYNAGGYQHNAGAHYNHNAHQRNASLQSNSSSQYGSVPSQTNGTVYHPNGSMPPPNTAFSPPAPSQQPGPMPPPWQQQNPNNNFPTLSSQQTHVPLQQPTNFQNAQSRHNSAPSLSGTGHFDAPLNDNDESLSSDLNFFSEEADNLETPYHGAECPYARSQDEIDPDLSLGEIVYRPALPTLRPLSATAREAELEAIAPRIPQPTDHESISEYFINSRRESNLLDVRQTDRWDGVRNDPVFRAFPAVSTAFISPAQMRANWRDRPDPNWAERVESPTPEPEPALPSTTSQESDVLNNLEQALDNSSNSLDNPNTSAIDRPRALGGVVRDQAQEDILASLGVTGPPKTVYQTPGPAYSRNNSISGHQNGPRGSISHPPPPPPPPPGRPPNGRHRSQSREEWSSKDWSAKDWSAKDWSAKDWADLTALHSRNRRSVSVSSDHTAAGSDFSSENVQIITGLAVNGRSGAEDPDRTPRAPLRAENRKRTFEGGDEDGAAGDSGSENSTPRPGRKAARTSK